MDRGRGRRDFDRNGPPRRGPPPFGRDERARRDNGGFNDRKPPSDQGANREPPHAPNAPFIDRTKVCPFLLRVFPRTGGHHPLEAFAQRTALPPELQMHTWKDATLREIAELVKEVNDTASRPSSRISFSLVYPDRTGKNVMRTCGVVHSTKAGPDDDKALRDLKFQIGDYLSVSIV